MIDAYGISRTRDKKGKIIKQEPLDWVNCIHTMVGGGWETMAVLVLEVYGKRRYNVQGEVHPGRGGGFTTTPQWSSSGVRCPDCQGL